MVLANRGVMDNKDQMIITKGKNMVVDKNVFSLHSSMPSALVLAEKMDVRAYYARTSIF